MINTEVAIIGGGIIGASCAYFLTLAGFDVVLLDRSSPGQDGATSKSKGIIRVFDPIEKLARLAASSVRLYQDWHLLPHLGPSPIVASGMVYRVVGRLNRKEMELIEELHTEAYPIRVCVYGDLGFSLPGCKWKSTDVVVFEPRGGFGDPPLAAARFASAAAMLGATVISNTGVSRIAKGKTGWTTTGNECDVKSEFVVMAAGAGSTDLLKIPCYTQSIPLPIFDTKINTLGLAIIDELAGTFVRPLSTGTLAVGSRVSSRAPWNEIIESASALQMADSKERLAAIFVDPEVHPNTHASFVGYDLYTEDLCPLIGESLDDGGVFLATGFSGRGFKMAPAVGVAIANLLSKKSTRPLSMSRTSIDIESFSPVSGT